MGESTGMANRKLHEGPDARWSWVVALSCCFINCLLYGVARLSGLLLVAAVDTFHVSRASAALPFSVSTSVRNLSGIFVGYLGQRFGVRPVITTGCVIASVGAGLCFFASNIFWVTLCWGGIFGTGFGLTTCLLPLAVNQHFDKHRGAASGISYSGSYIGSFVFPPLVVLLLNNYGLPGTFLIISGGILNVVAAAMLFRQPAQGNLKSTKQNSADSPFSLQDISETNSCYGKIWHKLLMVFKCKKTKSKFRDLTRTRFDPPVYMIAAKSLGFDHGYEKHSDIGSVEFLPSHQTTNEVERLNDALSVSCLFRVCARNKSKELPKAFHRDLELSSKNSYSKGKCKLRYKAKLMKLKHMLLVPLTKKHYSLFGDFKPVEPDCVTLISFRDLNYTEANLLLTSLTNKPSKKAICAEQFYDDNLPKRKIIENSSAPVFLNPNTSYESAMPTIEPLTNLSALPYHTYQTFVQSMDASEVGNSFHHKTSHGHRGRVSYTPSGSSVSSKFPRHESLTNADGKISPRGHHRSAIRNSALVKDTNECCFGWFRMYAEPMFLVISGTMALYTFVLVCVITIIEDFAKDLNIPDSRVHYVLMVLSIADLVGTLTLGAITDRRFVSRCHFVVVCFLGMAVTVTAISFSSSFVMLLTLVAVYGIFESGIIITFPLLIAQFIPVKKQAVAIASSNILSSPTVLLVPLVIGYFRDQIGCYSGVFYLLGVTSLICSFIWLLAPIAYNKFRRRSSSVNDALSC